MRVLYLTPRLPYPPNRGDTARTFNILRFLARRHAVTLVSLVDRADTAADLGPLRRWCREVRLVPNPATFAAVRGALALLRGHPVSVGYFGRHPMHHAVASVVEHGAFDAVLVMSSALAQYLPACRDMRRVVDMVDVDSEKWRQFARHSPAPARWLYAVEAERIARIESALVDQADALVVVSPVELDLYRRLRRSDGSIRVVGDGVDASWFAPPPPVESAGARLLFTGALDYRPNIDAVSWFVTAILPEIRRHVPDVRFTAVGHRPVASLLTLAGRSRGQLEIFGSVPDIRPYFSGASVYVAPLRMGRGVKVKMLEAMAMGMPIVGTAVAAEGLAIRHGVELLRADSAADFAAAVVEVLRDGAKRRALAAQARRTVERDFRWEAQLAPLDDILAPPAAAKVRA